MSRPLRIEYAGAIYHVTSRGDRREEIYLDDSDRQMWLDVLSQVRPGIGLPATWKSLTQQMYLAGDEFVEEIQDMLSAPLTGMDMQEVPRMQ